MNNGCVLANSGHFNMEINIPVLEAMAVERRRSRSSVDEYTLRDGRRIHLLAEGRLVNLAASEGVNVPAEIDNQVASLKRVATDIHIDELSKEQLHNISSWQEGTE